MHYQHQRSIFLTYGPLPEKVVEAFVEGSAAGSVAHLSLTETVLSSGFDPDMLDEQLRAVSVQPSRTELDQQRVMAYGRREINIWLCSTETVDPSRLKTLFNQLADAAARRLRVTVVSGGLCLPQLPNLEASEASIQALLKGGPALERGWLLASRINEAGYELHLDVYRARVTALLGLLAHNRFPQRLDQLLGHDPDREQGVTSIGLASWGRDPQGDSAYLAALWGANMLDGYLSPSREETLDRHMQAASTLVAQEMAGLDLCEPEERPIMERSRSGWRPWERVAAAHTLFDAIQPVLKRFRQANTLPSEPQTLTPHVVEQRWQSFRAAMLDWCQAEIRATPLGGIDSALDFLKLLDEILEAEWVRLEDDIVQSDATLARLSLEIEQMAQDLSDTLCRLPGPEIPAWAGLLLKPWRWPMLPLSMLQLEEEIAIGQAALADWYGQISDQTTRHRDSHLLKQLQDRLPQLWGEVEELTEMLYATRAAWSIPELPSEIEGHRANQLYAALTQPLPVELKQADKQLGGLGIWLDEPTFSVSEWLHDLGQARFATLSLWSLRRYLDIFFPQVEEKRRWFETLWEEAAPLWPADRFALSQREQLIERHSFLLLAAEAPHTLGLELKEDGLFGPATSPDEHWLSHPNRQQVTLVRLRFPVIGG